MRERIVPTIEATQTLIDEVAEKIRASFLFVSRDFLSADEVRHIEHADSALDASRNAAREILGLIGAIPCGGTPGRRGGEKNGRDGANGSGGGSGTPDIPDIDE